MSGSVGMNLASSEELRNVSLAASRNELRSRRLTGSLRRPPEPPHAAERLVDQRPEQQHNGQRRDRADQTVRPEYLHVAAGADHRQPERILGPVAEHQRQPERRQGNTDLLEDIADDAEA